MAIEIKAPAFPESVQDGVIAEWHVKPGASVKRDEPLVDIETDKVVLEVAAPADGLVAEILKEAGETVLSNELIGKLEEGAAADQSSESAEKVQGEPEPKREPAAGGSTAAKSTETKSDGEEPKINPAAKRLLEENDLSGAAIQGTGKGGRITRADVVNYMDSVDESGDSGSAPAAVTASTREEKRVPMSRLRARVAERLLQASQSTAMLTTFNEVDMTALKALRANYRDDFEQRHGVRLGYMSFFVRACVEALKKFPAVNASIDGDDIVYHGYQDIGVAVSSDRGLVVPVLRDADRLNLSDTESRIADFGKKAQSGQLTIEDMTGGTFTLSNGGVFGSLLSTPILNPPQTAILGMHKIQDRPVAINGEVVIRPMMYLALSYDHRLIDGKEAVQFLVAVKEIIEDPTRILLNL